MPGYFSWCLGETRQAQAVASANECINLWYHLLKKQGIKKSLVALTGSFLPRMACFRLGKLLVFAFAGCLFLPRRPVFASACLFLPRQAACICLDMPILASAGCLFLPVSLCLTGQRHSPGKDQARRRTLSFSIIMSK